MISDQIRQAGLEARSRAVGRVGRVRLLRQFEVEEGIIRRINMIAWRIATSNCPAKSTADGPGSRIGGGEHATGLGKESS